MRTLARAASLPLITGALLASTLSAPAEALTSASACHESASTKLVTTTLLGDPANHTRLWLFSARNRSYVCFVLPQGLGSGVVVVDHRTLSDEPEVHGDPGVCGSEVIDVADPVSLRVAYGATSVCLTVAGTTTAVTFADSEPPAVWRDGNGSVLDIAACSPLLVQALAGLGGAAQAYHDCTWRNERIV